MYTSEKKIVKTYTVKGTSFPLWDILLSTVEDCLALMKKDLSIKENILGVKYKGHIGAFFYRSLAAY